MVLGFNHNIRYRGEEFHVQTEDSGSASPHIITLLYRGGAILASQKTSYADILKVEKLEAVVEELMKNQHREMMRRLKSGEFDQRAFPDRPAPAEPARLQPPADAAAGVSPAPPAPEPPPTANTDGPLLFAMPVNQKPDAAGHQPAGRDNRSKNAGNLDDAILSFIGANEH